MSAEKPIALGWISKCDKCDRPLVIMGTEFRLMPNGQQMAVCGCGNVFEVTEVEWEAVWNAERNRHEHEHEHRKTDEP
jgi:hypothetical protein